MDPALALALSLETADYLQTRQIIDRPQQCETVGKRITCLDRSEQNPMLGRHPSQSRAAIFFGIGAASTVTLNQVLPESWKSRHIYTVIGFEAAIVSHNAYMGVHFHF
jgi:hypothetical protein